MRSDVCCAGLAHSSIFTGFLSSDNVATLDDQVPQYGSFLCMRGGERSSWTGCVPELAAECFQSPPHFCYLFLGVLNSLITKNYTDVGVVGRYWIMAV
jgi:hypothetical protein